MSSETSIILAAIIAGFALLLFVVKRELDRIREQTRPDEALVERVKSSQEEIRDATKILHQRLDNAARTIGGLQKSVGEMSEIGRGMRELQEFLQSPKLRGNIGEAVLKDLITQVMPKNAFFLQHSFKSGEKVDAALKTDAGLLPIDSKFPMENFRRMIKEEKGTVREQAKKEFARDVKGHVDDIASKYIVPEEGTMDFALMYIPAETVYYEIVNIPEVLEYARDRRVYPVSPTTLYAHLQLILTSFEGKRIERQARQVLASIRAIQKDYQKVEGNLGILGRHIGNAYNTMNTLVTSFTQLGHRIADTRTLGEEAKEEVKQLEAGEGK